MEYALLFPLAITLHNLEEAIWLPQWSKLAGRFQKPVGEIEFRFAVLIITVLAYLATVMVLIFPDSIIARYFFYGFLGAMMINVIVPHLAATVLLRRYAPGLATGLLLILPVNFIILYRTITDGAFTVVQTVIATVIVAVLLLAIIPLLFKLARR